MVPSFSNGFWFSGIIIEDQIKTSWPAEILLSLSLFLFSILMNFHFLTWLFIPIISVFAFLFLGQFVLRTRIVSRLFRWIGLYSSCLFVCHPIARIIINRLIPISGNLFFLVFLYLVLSFIFAFIYYLVINRIRKACIK